MLLFVDRFCVEYSLCCHSRLLSLLRLAMYSVSYLFYLYFALFMFFIMYIVFTFVSIVHSQRNNTMRTPKV